MNTRSDAIHVIGGERAVGTDVDHRRHVGEIKKRGVWSRIKHLIGKVATVDEEWIFKSKDWPYMWTKK